jgi:hypothetical protein
VLKQNKIAITESEVQIVLPKVGLLFELERYLTTNLKLSLFKVL